MNASVAFAIHLGGRAIGIATANAARLPLNVNQAVINHSVAIADEA